jgi:hypothetical protein
MGYFDGRWQCQWVVGPTPTQQIAAGAACLGFPPGLFFGRARCQAPCTDRGFPLGPQTPGLERRRTRNGRHTALSPLATRHSTPDTRHATTTTRMVMPCTQAAMGSDRVTGGEEAILRRACPEPLFQVQCIGNDPTVQMRRPERKSGSCVSPGHRRWRQRSDLKWEWHFLSN